MPDVTPEERRRIYEEEKIRFEAREQIKKETAAREAAAVCIQQQRAMAERQSRAKRSALISVGVISGLVLLFVAVRLRSKPEDASDVHTHTFDSDFLSGRPFGNGMGSMAFLEKQQKRHTLVLADMEDTRRLTSVGEKGQLELMRDGPLAHRKLELESMLAKLAGVPGWSFGEKEKVRAALSEELQWVTESIDAVNAAP